MNSKMIRVIGAVLAITGLGMGQAPLRAHVGPPGSADFGRSVAGGADLTLDSVAEYAVTSAVSPTQSVLQVFNGATGALVFQTALAPMAIPSPKWAYARCVAIGRFDPDAFADVLVAEPMAGGGQIKIYSGAAIANLSSPTQALNPIVTLTCPVPNLTGYGISVACVGDADGDGMEDFVVGADGGPNTPGYAFLYFGNPALSTTQFAASLIQFTPAPPPPAFPPQVLNGAAFGSSVGRVGNVTGTGRAAIAIGAPGWDRSPAAQGFVEIYTITPARTPQLFTVMTGVGSNTFAGDHFGVDIAPAGDQNLDGMDDFLVSGAPTPTSGYVQMYYGSTVGYVSTAGMPSGPSYINLGDRVAGGRDLDLDGISEYTVGGNGATRIYKGNTHCLLQVIPVGGPASLIGDLTGDARSEILIGNPASNTAYVYGGTAFVGGVVATLGTSITPGHHYLNVGLATCGGANQRYANVFTTVNPATTPAPGTWFGLTLPLGLLIDQLGFGHPLFNGVLGPDGTATASLEYTPFGVPVPVWMVSTIFSSTTGYLSAVSTIQTTTL